MKKIQTSHFSVAQANLVIFHLPVFLKSSLSAQIELVILFSHMLLGSFSVVVSPFKFFCPLKYLLGSKTTPIHQSLAHPHTPGKTSLQYN